MLSLGFLLGLGFFCFVLCVCLFFKVAYFGAF